MKTVEYDRAADALYVYLAKPSGAVTTKKVAAGVYADFDGQGKPVGIEFLRASKTLLPQMLEQATPTPRLMTLAEAEEESGLSAITLRTQIHNGRLRATKKGRDWIVDWDDVAAYLESRYQPRLPALAR